MDGGGEGWLSDGWKVGGGGGGGKGDRGEREREEMMKKDKANGLQYGGSPVKVGEEEYALFRDYELLAKINE
jgi:chaperonin GroES